MKEGLLEKHCLPCEEGCEPLDQDDIAQFLSDLSLDWAVVRSVRLRREFCFGSFMEAMVFVNDIAAVAEQEGHHPDIYIYFSRVIIELMTHNIDGLSDNDFIMARKIEELR